MGTSERKEREKEQRRQDIKDAAKELFLTQGFIQTTMAQIAETCELSKGTLYLYFTNKEELILTLIHESFQEMLKVIENAVDSPKSGVDKIKDICTAFYECYEEKKSEFFLTTMFESIIPNIPADNEVLGKCLTEINQIVEVVIEVVEKGKLDGTIRKDISTRKTAYMYSNVAMSFMERMSTHGEFIYFNSGFSEKELIEHMFEMFIESVRA